MSREDGRVSVAVDKFLYLDDAVDDAPDKVQLRNWLDVSNVEESGRTDIIIIDAPIIQNPIFPPAQFTGQLLRVGPFVLSDN
jgi:hypothetical protein